MITAVVEKMNNNQIEVRREILRIHSENSSRSYRLIAKDVGVSPHTVGRVIKKYSSDLTIERKSGSDKKAGPHSPVLEKTVVKSILSNRERSIRDIARKFGTSVGMVQGVKKRNNLRTYKKQKMPKRTPK